MRIQERVERNANRFHEISMNGDFILGVIESIGSYFSGRSRGVSCFSWSASEISFDEFYIKLHKCLATRGDESSCRTLEEIFVAASTQWFWRSGLYRLKEIVRILYFLCKNESEHNVVYMTRIAPVLSKGLRFKSQVFGRLCEQMALRDCLPNFLQVETAYDYANACVFLMSSKEAKFFIGNDLNSETKYGMERLGEFSYDLVNEYYKNSIGDIPIDIRPALYMWGAWKLERQGRLPELLPDFWRTLFGDTDPPAKLGESELARSLVFSLAHACSELEDMLSISHADILRPVESYSSEKPQQEISRADLWKSIKEIESAHA
ncbi:MAG: hypothetical protein K9H25_21930 [Rhodospirillum sp.]|nr:hypothetical protein [Rhodospirillum sp.]MCF8491712.1 hypothetical protein [Rhodospirillum sp.]